MNLLCIVVNVYFVICVIRVVLSWLGTLGEGSILGSIGTLTYAVTEPVFSTVRRYMPRMGDLPIDFSPIIVFILLGLIREIFCGFAG